MCVSRVQEYWIVNFFIVSISDEFPTAPYLNTSKYP
jgi:hypothetical protein